MRRSADELSSKAVEAVAFEPGGSLPASVSIPSEEAVTLVVNGQEFVTLLASPGERLALTAGFLFNEGIVDSIDQVTSFEEDAAGVRIEAAGVELGLKLFERRVLGSGCGKSLTSVSALGAFSAPHRSLPQALPWVGVGRLLAAGATTFERGRSYRRTRGTHAAGLFSRGGELVSFAEDIGRHNAVDKVIGRLVLDRVPLTDLFLVVTGRVSSEMVAKVAKTPIPLIASKSVPTSMAVENAQRLSVCVVGRMTRAELIAYTFPELIDPER